MKNFVRLYLKDYVIKVLSIPFLIFLKVLQIYFALFSLAYGLLKIPLIIFCILGVAVEVTSDPMRLHFVFGFVAVGIITILYRKIEIHIDNFLFNVINKLKNYIVRPVQLKTNIKFTL